jgi:SAM-dependent methyltransferase
MLKEGSSLQQIGRSYNISWTVVEREIKKMAEEDNRTIEHKAKPVKTWEPESFDLERTTVWSFPKRGSWATHRGDFRGNWAPEIPRNIILRYSKKDDLVLDQFVGSGTTLIEAKLLGRKSIGIDINPQAIEISRQRTAFKLSSDDSDKIYEPESYVGDARDLSDIEDESVDLVCAHPPYAEAIKFSSGIEGDMSHQKVEQFVQDMHRVVQESYRVLKPGRYCAFLIGDTRKKKRVISIGFRTWPAFIEAGFLEKENIIKIQHNCKATGFWRERSVEYNFLLLAHEYLFVFQKPL